jgi:hypothetical protein
MNAEEHRLRIAIDTVKNPLKGAFLGGPSLQESIEYLLSKGYSWTQLQKLNQTLQPQNSTVQL